MQDPPQLRAYLRSVQAITAASLSPAATLGRAQGALTRLLETPPVLGPEVRRLPAPDALGSGGYGRNLLFRDPDSGLVVLAMVWPPGFQGDAHDHGTWGTVGVLEGTVRIVNYGREDDGSDPDRIELIELSRIEAGPGAIATVLPPYEDFHSVGNASEGAPAITLHTYGYENPVSRHVDLETAAVTHVQASLTSKMLLSV